jgi:N-acyl-D-amino-acid deacylase
LGFSTGLNYAPASYADMDELVGLGQTVAEHDRLFTWHLRDYAGSLLPAVQQCLEVARRTGCRTEISHLTTVGKRNWGSVARALELVDAARAEGLSVNVDIYPYLHGNAPLAQLLPGWSQDGGAAAMALRLPQREVRDAIRAEWAVAERDWTEIVISGVPEGDPRQELVGQDIASIAQTQGVHPDEVALDILAALGPSVMIFAGGRCESDLLDVLRHPAAVIASDGMSLDPSGPTGKSMPHPRSYGCFPRYLARYVDGSDAAFADAVRRCTSAPADVAGLTGRGRLVPGASADIVVLDRSALADRATMTDPHQFPAGIEQVIVNGQTVVDGGQPAGRRPGAVIRAQ